MQISRGAASAIVLAAGLMAATPALAIKPPLDAKGSNYVFDFNALCVDCTAAGDGEPEFGEGILRLAGVTDLSALTKANFVDFTYSSSLVGDIDITAVTKFSGDFSDLSQVTVDIEGSNAPASVCVEKACPKPKNPALNYVFVTSTTPDGPNWSLVTAKGGTKVPNDVGTTYSWTAGAVPEPISWALMIAGFGLAGVRLRHDRRQAARAV